MINNKEKYLKENLIAYIGNKRRLLKFIENTFLSIIEKDKNIRTSLDLFAGSGSVSRLLKTLNLEVYSNDWEYYSYILNYAHLKINQEDVEKMFIHTGGLENTIEMLNSINTIKDDDRYISKYYAPEDDNNIDTINERLFYTQYNAKKIDIIRHNIEELFKNKAINQKEYYYLLSSLIYESATHTNTSGVFKAFHNGFGGRNKDALSRIMKPIMLSTIPLIDGKNCYVSREDANEFVIKNKDKHFDLVYLDPPYNQHQYGSNYHLLNTIALWDKPYINKEIYINGKKTNKSGIRKDWIKTKSDYCYKNTASYKFRELIENINTSHIVMSYSNDGIIEFEEIIDILESKGELEIVTSEYTKYRGAKRSIVNKTKNIEYLFVVNTKKKKRKSDNKIKHIENIRLKLQNPVECYNDFLIFNSKEESIKINLEYSTHIININEICDKLKSRSIEYINEFNTFINDYIRENNIDILKIYFNHLKSSIITNNKKSIIYFLDNILKIYSRLCSSKSKPYLINITNDILNIISYYKGDDKNIIKRIDKIKSRVVYNISTSSLNVEDKNKVIKYIDKII